MLIIRNGDKNGDRTLELTWHYGQQCPPIPSSWKSIEVYADGDERGALLGLLSMRFPSAASMAANPPTEARMPHARFPAAAIPNADATKRPDPLREAYELFLEVRRWREANFITAESYAYFLDRWALLCVQLRAGQ